MKVWQEATEMKVAVEAAALAAEGFDSLYEESAKNLLGRSPELMLLLSAYIAGKEKGSQPEQQAF